MDAIEPVYFNRTYSIASGGKPAKDEPRATHRRLARSFPDSVWILRIRRVSAASAAFFAARAGAVLSHRQNPDRDRFSTVQSRFTPKGVAMAGNEPEAAHQFVPPAKYLAARAGCHVP